MKVYEEAINATSEAHAPWYVIPADKKGLPELLLARSLLIRLNQCNCNYLNSPLLKN
jgi:polyphosphate kinase 2 (PPK2 family)